MPLYLINHTTTLSSKQKASLAAQLTRLHSTSFNTPTLFVNVRFHDHSAVEAFIGGAPRRANSITAHVRTGPSRTRSDFDKLCADVVAAWEAVVSPSADEQKLHSVFILGDIVAGWEAGFAIPQAGGDVAWLAEHWGEFEQRARNGDADMAALVSEVGERGLLSGIQANGAAKRRPSALLEMVGDHCS